MNQREVIYADVHVVTPESRTVEMILDDDRVEYAKLNIKTETKTLIAVSSKKNEATSKNSSNSINKNHRWCNNYYGLFTGHVTSCNLDNLLIQLRSEVTPYWFQFGTIIGMDEATLQEYSKYPPGQCLIEVLDYWVRIHDNKPTWRGVSDVLKEIKLNKLAEDILKVYETGIAISYFLSCYYTTSNCDQYV